MTDTAPTITAARSWLEAIDPKVAAGAVLIALCLGVWVGFKIAGGSVIEMAPCPDCEQKARERATERAILDDEPG